MHLIKTLTIHPARLSST